GGEGDGFKIAMQTLDFTRPGTAIGAVGVAQAAYELSVEYAKERVTFDVPIAMHQGVNFMIADMATEIEAARLLTWQAAWMLDRADALTLARAGADVVIADLLVESDLSEETDAYGPLAQVARTQGLVGTESAAEEIRAMGRRALAVRCDVTDRGQVAAAVARAVEELGSVDILVNNAGTLDHVGQFPDQNPDLWERDLRVNLSGAF